MDLKIGDRFVSSIQGQLLRRSERREVAIYLCKDSLWVADFIDGHGAVIDATTWFRFNCGALSSTHARRRMILESAVPLSMELAARIERLHRPLSAEGRHNGPCLASGNSSGTSRSRQILRTRKSLISR